MGNTIEWNSVPVTGSRSRIASSQVPSTPKHSSTAQERTGLSEENEVSFSRETRSSLGTAAEKGSGSGTHGDPRIQQLKRNFSPGAQGYSRVQQLKGNFSSGALKAYERLTKDEKSRLEDTLHGITRKQVKLASLEIDNRKSFINGHPYVKKGLGPLNGEQENYNTFDEKKKEYDNLFREGRITREEHARRTEMNQRFKEMSPEQRKSFLELLHLDNSQR